MKIQGCAGSAVWAACLSLAFAQESFDSARDRQGRPAVQAIAYEYLSGPTLVDFRGTERLPGARGVATVQSREGCATIDADFDRLEPASTFGPEYLTYVLWAISPAGRPVNLGEIVVNKGRARLKASTQLQTFALIVSAEPHFAVTRISEAAVLESAIRPDTKGEAQAEIVYEPVSRRYYSTAGLAASENGGKVSPYIYQARNALRIARLEKADDYAFREIRRAERLLAEAERGPKLWTRTASALARQSAQQSEDARLIALRKQGGTP